MNRAAVALVVLGIAQMCGDLLRIDVLKGVAAATTASPAPKVFSAVRGLETYSTRFFIEQTDGRQVVRTELTTDVYSEMAGPYNRRNIYGAALAYAPVLPASLRDPVMARALCGDAPLLRELKIPVLAGARRSVHLAPLAGSELGSLATDIEATCR